jgi:CheY-like chemotaxis protein
MRKAKERLIKALIVDDNEVNYLVLSNMLSVFHIAADEAVSGKQAIKMCKKEEYNLIFIDHLMYEMDGLETTIHLRRILTDKDKAYIFALTGEVTSEIRVKYLDAGANDVFTKPLGFYELNSILFR